MIDTDLIIIIEAMHRCDEGLDDYVYWDDSGRM